MDNTLKHRLIGATVLVALAVIFLPMLIKGPATDGGADDISLQAPAAPGDGQLQTRELPLVMPPARGQGSVTGMPAAPLATPPEAAETAEVAPAQAAAGDFAVNYGAYANSGDAQTVISSLKDAGLPAFSEQTTVNQQAAWRVRIGPFGDRAAAESARLRAAALRADVTPQVVVLDGKGGEMAGSAAAPASPAATPAQAPASTAPTPAAVAQTPPPRQPASRSEPTPAPRPAAATPPPTTPAARPAASSVGWVVQLGAFSNAGEANALRERMRASGFSAFVEQVPTDRGSLNRVRVGPVASREAAEQLKAQLAARTGTSGMVRQHP